MTTFNKIFPLKLSQNYHGAQKAYKRPSQLYHQKASQRQNSELIQPKISKWQRKRYDQDIIKEKKQQLIHPAKISSQNPEWLKNTYHYFSRNAITIPKKQSRIDLKQYNVFGQRKISEYTRNNKNVDSVSKYQSVKVAGKVGETDRKIQLKTYKSEIAPKIGSLQTRDYIVKKPQMKIGVATSNNFIDTYTIS